MLAVVAMGSSEAKSACITQRSTVARAGAVCAVTMLGIAAIRLVLAAPLSKVRRVVVIGASLTWWVESRNSFAVSNA